jgi:hypothetical protein
MRRPARARAFWQRAVGLIAGYAFALQLVLGGLLVAQATFDPAAAICLTDSGGHAAPLDQAPGTPLPGSHHGDHCALCTLHAPALPGPGSAAHLAFAFGRPVTIGEPARLLLPKDIHARPGRPRDPPRAA